MKAWRESLRADLAMLGVVPGNLLMVHASLRAVGPVVGGVESVVRALRDAVGAGGTLFAYVDFEPGWDGEADPAHVPVFDVRAARAARDHGILHEVLRTWPGSMRSAHPDAGVVANGPLAEWLVAPHPFRYGYGDGTPLARFSEAGGKVLMLGAPLDTITLLHLAEHRARLPDKRVVRYRRLMPAEDAAVWLEFEEFDTARPVSPRLDAEGPYFARIAEAFLAAGHGRSGRVGGAESHLFDAGALLAFAIAWLERVAG